MRKLQLMIVLITSTFLLSSFSSHQVLHNGGWEVLGTKTVGMHGDHDELWVTHHEGAFTKLKFKVSKAPIYVRNVKVVYASGASENHKVSRKFQVGASSGVLDLNGGYRVIKKIIFNYDTINNGNGRAKLTAFGRH